MCSGAEDSCADSKCGQDFHSIANMLLCGKVQCGKEDCCEASVGCDDHVCTPGTVKLKDAPSDCNADTCANDVCCGTEDTCDGHQCPSGHHLSAGGLCGKLKCSDADCCEKNTDCDGFACPLELPFANPEMPENCGGPVCAANQCCVEEDTCADVKCGKGSHLVSTDGCGKATCMPADCCAPNQACDDFTCKAGFTSISRDTCDSKKCTTEECCQENPSCTDFNCPKNFFTSSDAVCVTDRCKSEECCEQNPSCASYECPDDFHRTNTGICKSSECAKDECCAQNQKCTAYNCGAGFHALVDASNICDQKACTQAECCGKNPTCELHQCPSGHHKISTAVCAAAECSTKECCDENPTCADYECPDHHKSISTDTCKGKTCSTGECCQRTTTTTTEKFVYCDTYTCPAGTEKNLRRNSCDNSKCTTEQCCDPIVPTTTTTTKGEKPDPDTECQGEECIIEPICKKGTILTFDKANLKANNLGGMGPVRGAQKIHYGEVGELDGRKLDCIITAKGAEYYRRNARYRSRRSGKTGFQFIAEYNGAHPTKGAGVVGTMAPGSYEMHFKFVWSDNQQPATIPYLPLTFYDIDGGFEETGTCEAVSSVVHKPSGIRGGCKNGCCSHAGSRNEIDEPQDWEQLTLAQKMGAVTYLFKDASEFDFKYKTTYEHRIFIFKGSKALACVDDDGNAVWVPSPPPAPAPCGAFTCPAGQRNMCGKGGGNQMLSRNKPVGGRCESRWGRFRDVNDGSSRHWHACNGVKYDSWLVMDLQAEYTISSMSLTQGSHYNYGYRKLDIQRSTDGRHWYHVRTDYNRHCGPGVRKNHNGWAAKTRFVRVKFHDMCGGGHYAIRHWDIFGEKYNGCTADKCCQKIPPPPKPSCLTYQCPAGYMRSSTAVCQGGTCSSKQCCEESTVGDRMLCKVFGDPHIQTFDDVYAERLGQDVFNFGDYYLVKAPNVQIQGRLTYSAWPKSSTGEIMMQGDALRGKLLNIKWNGEVQLGNQRISRQFSNDVLSIVPSGNGGYIRFKTDNTIEFEYTLRQAGNSGLLNLNIHMNQRPGVTGFCGNMNGNQRDDAQFVNNKVSQVPGGESLWGKPMVVDWQPPAEKKCEGLKKQEAEAFCTERLGGPDEADIHSDEFATCRFDHCMGGADLADMGLDAMGR